MQFEIVGQIDEVQCIASGSAVKIRAHLNKAYGTARWRKMKGLATIRLLNGLVRRVELHWYEAHGVGRRDMKIKRFADE